MIFPLTVAGAIDASTDQAVVKVIDGLPFDAAGKLACSQLDAATLEHNGFNFGPSNRFRVSLAGGGAGFHDGFLLTADGAVCATLTDPGAIVLHNGLKFDATGRVFMVGIT